jgi:hypothetical protein
MYILCMFNTISMFPPLPHTHPTHPLVGTGEVKVWGWAMWGCGSGVGYRGWGCT